MFQCLRGERGAIAKFKAGTRLVRHSRPAIFGFNVRILDLQLQHFRETFDTGRLFAFPKLQIDQATRVADVEDALKVAEAKCHLLELQLATEREATCQNATTAQEAQSVAQEKVLMPSVQSNFVLAWKQTVLE